jgi:hypothetical protein
VFITANGYTGNLGGVSGADQTCRNEAAAAGLSGTYLAWVSSSAYTPLTRASWPDATFRLVNGPVVADSLADLTDGSIDARINVSAGGVGPYVSTVWTNTTESGAAKSTVELSACSDWTYDGEEFRTAPYGRSCATDAAWTNANAFASGKSQLRLYCFQVA